MSFTTYNNFEDIVVENIIEVSTSMICNAKGCKKEAVKCVEWTCQPYRRSDWKRRTFSWVCAEHAGDWEFMMTTEWIDHLLVTYERARKVFGGEENAKVEEDTGTDKTEETPDVVSVKATRYEGPPKRGWLFGFLH